MRTPLVLLLSAGALSLGACAYDGAYYGESFGLGYADAAYDPGACWNYGWNGWAGWNGPYMPYCGWYDGFFYPGEGIYVYDRGHHRHRWDGHQQAYWTQRATEYRSQPRTTAVVSPREVPRTAPAVSAPRITQPMLHPMMMMPRMRAPRPAMRGGFGFRG